MTLEENDCDNDAERITWAARDIARIFSGRNGDTRLVHRFLALHQLEFFGGWGGSVLGSTCWFRRQEGLSLSLAEWRGRDLEA